MTWTSHLTKVREAVLLADSGKMPAFSRALRVRTRDSRPPRVTYVGKPNTYRRKVGYLSSSCAENAELREILNECADDLQTELEHRYGYPAIHPAVKRKFDRDMAPVEQARALLARTAKD